jgi:hypothetical protein
VVPPQDGTDTARTEGTLRITETCVVLITNGGAMVLVWPADRTTWNAGQGAIAFANDDGSTMTAGDGDYVVLGGSADSFEDGGVTPQEWLVQTPWVQAPDPTCPLDTRWWVGALTRSTAAALPQISGS